MDLDIVLEYCVSNEKDFRMTITAGKTSQMSCSHEDLDEISVSYQLFEIYMSQNHSVLGWIYRLS